MGRTHTSGQGHSQTIRIFQRREGTITTIFTGENGPSETRSHHVRQEKKEAAMEVRGRGEDRNNGEERENGSTKKRCIRREGVSGGKDARLEYLYRGNVGSMR